LACCHLRLAISLGGCSSCFTHCRVAESSAEPTSTMPVNPRRPPTPTSTPPPTNRLRLTCQKANRARRGARGGRSPAFDRERYRQRNQVERLMNRRKQFRAVATRFGKLAVRYQATIAVADIFIWLRARPDRSRADPRNTP
jgi:transposase